MLELTHEQCEILKATVTQQLCPDKNDADNFYKLYQTIVKSAVSATIATIQEYERMKSAQQADQ